MRKATMFVIFLSFALATACAGSPLNPGGSEPVAPAENQPTPAPAVDNGAPLAPATTDGGTTTTGCLTVEAFASMWKASSTSQGPGPLIQVLNNAWDMSQGAIGTQWPVGPQSVEPMSLVWTDLLSNRPPAGQGKWVPLRTQGQWGVFAVYDSLTVPSPGRSARLCTSLDPAKDLAGW